jgi:ABC-type transport system substrate-binding protein
MLKSKKWALLSGFMIISTIISACQPQVVTQVVEKVVTSAPEVVVQTQVVQQTQVIEIEKEAWQTPHPILSDLRVRQAIAYCTNTTQIAQAAYPSLTEAEAKGLYMDSPIQSSHWAHAAGLQQYPFDVAKAGALLDEAGWKLAEGATYRTNEAGDELSLRFTTTNAQFRQTWAAVFEANMKDCGIRIVRLHAPGAWWFGSSTGLRRRDFELGAFAWVGEADPGGRSLYACDSIPLPSNNWDGQNYMGWCNETASNAIKAANNTLNRDERIKQYAIFQQEFAKDMASLPIFSRANFEATNAALEGFAPSPGEPYTTYNVYEWAVPGADTLILGFTQEPATLFTIIESAFVAVNAKSLIDGRAVTSLGYDYAANLYWKQLPTLENGGAVLATVEPKAGDKVVDANGDIAELADGVKVVDETGATVDWKAGVKMQQITLNWELESGITWSDGEPLKAADMELNFKIDCDQETGAVDYTICERTVGFEATDTTQKVTLMPGYLYPLYFTIGFGWYPSHQVLGDGRKLADVPAKEWSTLPELAETPLGTGPYAITEWVKGQQMTFVANEFFYKGAPKTANVVVKFIADSQQAVAQLLTNDVDVLFSETILGVEAKTLQDEIAGGAAVKLYTTPSATWEHVDFNLFVR